MNKHSVICPYCEKSIQNDIDTQNWAENVSEIISVPIVERVGRLATTTSWVSKNKDPRLGGLLSVWNNTVGLLRAYQNLDVNVMKKEILCPNCNSPFDCYVNLDPQHSFNDFWPHLTGNTDNPGQFIGSGAKSFAEKLFSLGEKVGINPITFIMVLALSFCLITLLPYIPFSLQNSALVDQAILRSATTILVAIMIWSIKQTSEHIRGSFDSLQDLLIVPNHNSLQFWLNFTLGRVTGVSFPKQNGKSNTIQNASYLARILSKITVTQASVVGGLPSVIIAVLIWRLNYLPKIGNLTPAILMELVFWLIIMYFTGVTAWVGFNIGVYLLQNASFIPMKLTPFNGFGNLAPIKRIAILSLQMVIPVALLPLVFLIALLALPDSQNLIQLWLLPWVRLCLGIGFIIIGLGDTGILILGVIYIFLITILSTIESGTSTQLILTLDEWISLGVFGLFLSSLLGYHLSRAFGPLNRIVKLKKQETITRLNRILVSLSDELAEFDENLSSLSDIDTSHRDKILQDIRDVIYLRDKVMSTRIDMIDIRTSLGVLSPFISSIVLPFTLDILKTQIFTSP